MTKSNHKRSSTLVNRKLQLRLVIASLAITSIALMLQFLLLSFFVTRSASQLDGGGGALADQLPAMLITVLVLTMAITLPTAGLIGIRMTFRIAGPIARMEAYMQAKGNGEQVGRLSIRDGDELQTLCDAINYAHGHSSNPADAEHSKPQRHAA